MNNAKCWVSSFKKLCQAFTAAAFNYCLFVDISAFNFIFSKEKIYILNWVRVSGICHFISFPCLSFPLWLLSLFSASAHLSCSAAFDWTENMLWTPPCIVDVAISKISLCKLIGGGVQPNHSLLPLHCHLFEPHIEKSNEQLPNATIEINSEPFASAICHEIMREPAIPGTEATYQSLFQLPLSVWKWRDLVKSGSNFCTSVTSWLLHSKFILRDKSMKTRKVKGVGVRKKNT